MAEKANSFCSPHKIPLMGLLIANWRCGCITEAHKKGMRGMDHPTLADDRLQAKIGNDTLIVHRVTVERPEVSVI